MGAALLIAGYLAAPLLILHLCRTSAFLARIGPIVVAYAVGFVIGNIGLLMAVDGHAGALELITLITIPVAIPLLLFGLDLRGWRTMAGKTLLSMVIAVVAVSISVLAGYLIFHGRGIESLPDVAGMMVGLYTGSTPNLASIKIALGADETTYLLIATYDLVVGAFHLLFVMTVARRLFLVFLPPYGMHANPEQTGYFSIGDKGGKAAHKAGQAEQSVQSEQAEPDEPFFGLFRAGRKRHLAGALLLAAGIFGVGGLTSLVTPEEWQMAVVILVITTLGLAASLIPAVNRIERTFELGMYLIMVFCMAIASMADLSRLDFASLMIGAYVALVVFGSMAIQAGLSRFFRIDADTCLITSTALICNPAIVPVVAGAIGNRDIILYGLTVGIAGLALGNYLGVFMAWMLRGFGG